MAETERTFVELQTLLADNTGEAISPRDLRDAIVSALGGYGCLVVEGNAATQALTAVAAKIVAFDTAGPGRGTVASVADSNIVIGAAGDYLISCTATVEVTGGPTSLVTVHGFINDVEMAGLFTEHEVKNERTTLGFLGIVTLAAAAVLDLRATAVPSIATLFRDVQFIVKRCG